MTAYRFLQAFRIYYQNDLDDLDEYLKKYLGLFII
jgi:hypothetical protein